MYDKEKPLRILNKFKWGKAHTSDKLQSVKSNTLSGVSFAFERERTKRYIFLF